MSRLRSGVAAAVIGLASAPSAFAQTANLVGDFSMDPEAVSFAFSGGLALFAGYCKSALRGAPRFDPEYVAYVQRQQLERINLRHLAAYRRATRR